MTSRDRILKLLANASGPLAIHEFGVDCGSGPAVSARLRELTREGLTECAFRSGSRFKEWKLRAGQGQLL